MGIRPVIPSKNLTELSLDQLVSLFDEWGEPAYRAKQVYRWVFQRGVRDIDQMTNLSKALRTRLRDEGYSVGRVRLGRVAESIDGTRKLSIKLDDGSAVETVLIPMEEGNSRSVYRRRWAAPWTASSATRGLWVFRGT